MNRGSTKGFERPGVGIPLRAGLDRLRFSGLYLVCEGLNPPRAPWSFLTTGLFCLGRRIVEHLFGDCRTSVASGSRLLPWFGVDRKSVRIDLIRCRSFVRTCPARVRTVIDKCGQATKGAGWMSWHQEATKDVAACDKLREAGKRALIRGCLNEETRPGNPRSSATEFIGCRSEPRELKHLSTWRKRKRHRFRK